MTGIKRLLYYFFCYQLHLFGYLPSAPKREFEKLVLSVASNSLPITYRSYYRKFKKDDDASVRVISYALRRMVAKKITRIMFLLRWESFGSSLENVGAVCALENGKIKISYTAPGKWKIFSPSTKIYYLNFGGWTRVVGAKTARETLQNLGIYDQFASYKDLLEGADPLYQLVDDFKEPLRRLKDK